RLLQEPLEDLGEALRGGIVVLDDERAAGADELGGVAALVVGGRVREGNEDRRRPDDRQLGDGARPGAADRERGGTEQPWQLRLEGDEAVIEAALSAPAVSRALLEGVVVARSADMHEDEVV